MDPLHLRSFVSETVGDSNTRQTPWAAGHEIEVIISVLHRPMLPQQFKYGFRNEEES